MRKRIARYATEEQACKALDEIIDKCGLVLCLQYDEKQKIWFFEH